VIGAWWEAHVFEFIVSGIVLTLCLVAAAIHVWWKREPRSGGMGEADRAKAPRRREEPGPTRLSDQEGESGSVQSP